MVRSVRSSIRPWSGIIRVVLQLQDGEEHGVFEVTQVCRHVYNAVIYVYVVGRGKFRVRAGDGPGVWQVSPVWQVGIPCSADLGACDAVEFSLVLRV